MSATQSPGRKKLSAEGCARILCHAQRRGIDHAVSRSHRLGDVLARASAAGPESSGEEARELLGPCMIGVDDRELAHALCEEGIADRGAGAASAELHHAAARNVGQLAPEALGEAPPVGVVPDAPCLREHDRVDRAKRPRVWRELVQSADHRLLARVRDVEAGEAETLRRGDDLGQGLDAEPQHLEVNKLVDVAKPVLGSLPLVQGRAARALDAASDEADQNRRTGRWDRPGDRRPGRSRAGARKVTGALSRDEVPHGADRDGVSLRAEPRDDRRRDRETSATCGRSARAGGCSRCAAR